MDEQRGSDGSDGNTPTSETTPESFTLETKFVVLNFLSYDPHETPPCRIYTPTTSTSDSDPVTHRKRISVKSLPTTPGQLSYRKKSRGSPEKLQKLRTLGESEDNITHRYRRLQKTDFDHYGSDENSSQYRLDKKRLAQHDRKHKASSLDSIMHRYDQSNLSESLEHHETTNHSEDNVQPEVNEISQYRHQTMSRTVSEVSSVGDISYAGDADDEFEDSNATNKLSNLKSGFSRSEQRHDGIDWLQVSKLSTVPSESETEDLGLLTPNTGIFDPHLGEESAVEFGFEFGEINKDPFVDDHSINNDTLVYPNVSYEVHDIKLPGVFGSVERDVQRSDDRDNQTVQKTDQSGHPSDAADCVDGIDRPVESPTNSSMGNNASASLDSEINAGTLSTSISIDESANDTTNSSSFDMTDACRYGHRVLDRSRLKLDIPQMGSLVQTAQRQAVVESMKAELEDEMTTLESEVEEAIKNRVIYPVVSPFLTPVMTPQTEAANILAKIGDEVKEMYEDRLQNAMQRLFIKQQVVMSYDTFKNVAKDVVDDTLPGWRQVALLLVYGQSVVWRAVETGHHGIGNLVDHTSRLVADVAADFIIQQGGWGAVMNFNPSQSSDSQFSTPDSLRDVTSWLPASIEQNESNCLQSEHILSKSFQSVLGKENVDNVNLTANNNVHHFGEISPEFKEPTESLGNLSSDSMDDVTPDMLYFNHISSEKDTQTNQTTNWWQMIFNTYFIMVHSISSVMFVYVLSKYKN